MRVSQIAVRKLFGVFDHTVDLNLTERITIIHGPNGFGKTALLQMIYGLFSGRYSVFRTYPFTSFSLTFDDSSRLSIERRQGRPAQRSFDDAREARSFRAGRARRPETGLELTYTTKGGEPQSFLLNFDERRPDIPLGVIEHYVPALERVGPTRWTDRVTGETLSFADVIEHYQDELPSSLLEGSRRSEPKWLGSLRDQMQVRFIQSQRLVEQSSNRDGSTRATAAVERYAVLLRDLIQSTLAKYAEISQSKDRTFPQRLRTNTDPAKGPEEIRATLDQLEKKRQSLVKSGLLDPSTLEPNFLPSISDAQLKPLSIYVKDVEDKLSVFDETAEKIDLFKNIIGKLFKYKRLRVDRASGFDFSTDDNQPLTLTSLSSGEQHEVVLLSSLLLNDQPATLFLIDEPEISLHVYWQKQFLRDLAAITSLLQVDVIIATHSPQIINDRWDLTVQLQGPPEKERVDVPLGGGNNSSNISE